MERVRDELRRPAVWLVPMVVAAIQLVGTADLVIVASSIRIGCR
jgi:hypothetical protein